MKFAMNENTLFQCELIEYLDACKAAGFEAVEISYAKVKEALRFLSAKEVKDAIKPMKVISINAFEDVFLAPESSWATVVAEGRLFGELSKAIDCPAVVLPSGRWYEMYGPLVSEKEITQLYRTRLIEMVELFKEYDVTVMFEPIAYPEFIVGTVSWTNEILDTPELRDLPIVPDIHNMHRNKEGSDQLKNLKNPIGIFHIDDTIKGNLDELHVAKSRTFPGDGVADAKVWFQTVKQTGFDGYYSLELFDDTLYAMSAHDAAQLCMDKLHAFAKTL
ncbi:MAG: sugar phosphate isomerase/epimerase family protein [Sphaerochaetaceae bacterium]